MSLSIENNIAKLLQHIRQIEQKFHRSAGSVTLMAVSKTRPAQMIRQAVAAGVTDVGENYLQEALDKKTELSDLDVQWHFIGPLQSNKTRPVAEQFDWVHSVDRMKIAQRLNDQRPDGMAPLNICLQVNISGEESKSGASLEALPDLANQVTALPRITLRGLMAIPEASNDENQQRVAFARLRQALEQLQPLHPQLDTLSMGMSRDMAAAIAEGATMVRIGTDIFGKRD